MARKKQTAVAAGLTAVALATGIGVGVSTLSEPTAIVEETGSFAGAMSELEQAVDALVDKSDERGMTLPQSPGINDVTTGMDGMTPTKGTTRTVTVSGDGAISKGDYLKVCEEFVPLEGKAFADDGVKIVAVTSNGVDGIHCEDRTHWLAAILFTQGGNTNLRMVKFEQGGKMAFSNTLTIAHGVELEYADMAMDHYDGQCFIAYNIAGAGWMSRVQCDGGKNRITLSWNAQWRQSGDPQNICVAYDTFSDFACICSTVLPDGSTDENKRFAELTEMAVLEGGVVMSPTPYPLTVENCPSLYGIDYSTAPTAKGWDISYVTNWHYDMMARKATGESGDELTDEDVAGFVLQISYPKAVAGGRGLITVDHNAKMECNARNYVENTASGYSSNTTVAIDIGATTGELGYVAMTDVVHSVYNGERNYLFIETYGVQKEGSKPVCYMRSRPGEVYQSRLENISYALMGKESAIGYTVDGVLYAQIHELQRVGSVFGPAKKIADAVGYAGIVPVSADEVACIYVDKTGIGRIVPLKKTRVVSKESESMAAWATGTALESGQAGETIRADLNYWPDEKW